MAAAMSAVTTPVTPYPSVPLIRLHWQDIDLVMGPTVFLPRSHTEDTHDVFVWGQPQPWGVVPDEVRGDGGDFDAGRTCGAVD